MKEHYFMDDPREAKRLTDKVDAAGWLAAHIEPYLEGVTRVLDVGCGPGTILAGLVRQRPNLTAVGIDLSQERIEEAQTNLVPFPTATAQVGDAANLPFQDDSFDLVYCRLLLEYLPERGKAVSAMVRVCRRGGQVVLYDLDGQLVWHYPPDQELEEGLAAVLQHLSRSGFDPFVGRKLYALARAAGLVDLQVGLEAYHLYAGRIDKHQLQLWETKLDIAARAGRQVLGKETYARLKQRFLDYLQREDTLTYSVAFTVVGRKPGSL